MPGAENGPVSVMENPTAIGPASAAHIVCASSTDRSKAEITSADGNDGPATDRWKYFFAMVRPPHAGTVSQSKNVSKPAQDNLSAEAGVYVPVNLLIKTLTLVTEWAQLINLCRRRQIV